MCRRLPLWTLDTCSEDSGKDVGARNQGINDVELSPGTLGVTARQRLNQTLVLHWPTEDRCNYFHSASRSPEERIMRRSMAMASSAGEPWISTASRARVTAV